jgi:hypothetical protein
MLSYLGTNWARAPARFQPDQIVKWTRQIIGKGRRGHVGRAHPGQWLDTRTFSGTAANSAQTVKFFTAHAKFR